MPKSAALNLVPAPRALKRKPGKLLLPARAPLRLDPNLNPDEARAVARRLQSGAKEIGVELVRPGACQCEGTRSRHSQLRVSEGGIKATLRAPATGEKAEAYQLTINQEGVSIEFHETGGLRAAVATLRQLLREHGRQLPCLQIRDWPDFPRRGVMLDISRGRVPKLATLLDLADQLADFKINELQLYTEHTFAYRRHRSVWRGWGAVTGQDIQQLDARCRELGIDLVPNQNCFGHLRHFLADPQLQKLAEVPAPYEAAGGEFVRHPTTLAPNHPATLPFLRGLFDELLPNFSSRVFNVGCDETWDLGRGRSKKLCAKLGRGRVYVNFLKRIQHEVAARRRTMMFWGDIILHYPELIKDLPREIVALNWGYEADHPFEKEAARFAKSKIPFYVCPGTSTWMTLVGRHENALANLRAAARAGKKHGAMGYLNTDWGDGGHPQPLAVSWPLFAAGAALSWNPEKFDEAALLASLSRDIFHDPSGRIAKAGFHLGFAHLKLKYSFPNSTPLGSVIAAPPPEQRELFCRDGLNCFAQISPGRIRATLAEIEKQLRVIARAKPAARAGEMLQTELELAARMAAQSCRFMLWQHAVAAEKIPHARRLAAAGMRALRKLSADFQRYWPRRNQGTTRHCSAFLRWRIEDYSRGALPVPAAPPKTAS